MDAPKHENHVVFSGVVECRVVKTTQAGSPMCVFTVRSLGARGETRVRVVTFDALAEKLTAEIADADFVRVEGRLNSRRYQQDGRWVSATEIVAAKISTAREAAGNPIASTTGCEITDPDIPF